MNKETLQQQIADMEAKLAEMKEELNKSKKFQCSYDYGNTYFIGSDKVHKNFNGSDNHYIDHGRYRKTQQAAEMSLARNKRANRLEALAEQLGGLKEFDSNECNYYIYLDNNEWIYSDCVYFYYPEVVYMTEKCVIEICRMLNEGEFSLDGEI